MNGGEGDGVGGTDTAKVNSLETSRPKESTKPDNIVSSVDSVNTTVGDGDSKETTGRSTMEDDVNSGEQVGKAPCLDKGQIDTGDTEMISEEEDFSDTETDHGRQGQKDAQLLVTDEELLLSSDDNDEVVIPQLCDEDDSANIAATTEDYDPLAEGDEHDQNATNEDMGDDIVDTSMLPGAGREEMEREKSPSFRQDLNIEDSKKMNLNQAGLDTAESLLTERDDADVEKELCNSKPESPTVDVDKRTSEDIIEISDSDLLEDSTLDEDIPLAAEKADDEDGVVPPGKEDEHDNAEDPQKLDDSKGSDEDEDRPMIRMNSSIFEAQNDDDDDDDEGMDPEAIQSMMEVNMGECSSSGNSPKRKVKIPEEIQPRRTPRRQAAVVASNTIRKISNLEKEVELPGKSKEDVEYVSTVSIPSNRPSSGEKQSSTNNSDKQRCHQCKMTAPSVIVVRQYGTDIHLCSNNCFNTFRNPDPSFRPLPCAKCGALNRDTENSKLYFWETMNFCSDLCVGNFQLQIGSSCSTCSKRTPWTCMGKYCVRFGSDIRQFCTAACLETYKRNARVCFHCQLDIKKLGNVVLANIPNKSSPKEFCSQDCVEQYVDQNISNGNKPKNIPTIHCHVCKTHKQLYKELVTAIMVYKVCSLHCWDKLLDLQMIRTPTKCETCEKFINMDTISISPSVYVATEKKAHGFCSATCKNVFVLKTRQIRPCTSCQVKKYNYDLIQHNGGGQNFAVCSLNCLPKPSQYILSLKTKLADPSYIPPTVSIVTTGTSAPVASTLMPVSSTMPFETYNISLPNEMNYNGGGGFHQEIQIDGVGNLADGTVFMNGDGTYQYEVENGSEYSVSLGTDELTVREVSQEEFIQLRNAAGVMNLGGGNEVEIQTEGEGVQYEVGVDHVPYEDEMWADFDKIMALSCLLEPAQVRNKACQVRPIRITKETQTDCSELTDMPRIEPKVKVLIVPVPVFIPFPVYSCSQPVPVPYPVGIPVPIPIPMILNQIENQKEAEVLSSSTPLVTSENLVPEDKSDEPLEPDTPQETDEVEMMDTSEPLEADLDPADDATPESNLNAFNTFGTANSPMNLGSPSLFKGTSSPNPGSPSVIGRGRGSRSEYGLRAWKLFFGDEDPATLTPDALSGKFVEWIERGTKPKGDRYQPDAFLYFFLGIQQHLRTNGRPDQIFYETVYTPFVVSFTAYTEQEMSRGCCISKVEEDHVWDANELGPNSPGVLLFTLVYYIYKNFGLKTWEEHVALQFNQVKINERKSSDGTQERYVTITGISNSNSELIEVAAEPENPYRCMVKLLEFYSSKCESTEGSFYKSIKLMADPRAEWYCSDSLSQMDLYRMLVRAQMICFA